MKVHISKKLPESKYDPNGDVIELWEDGTLTISGYDGMTHLNKKEAEELAKILLDWAKIEVSS